MVAPYEQEPQQVLDLESVLVQRTKRRFTRWAWRLFYGFLICLFLNIAINAGFTQWRNSLNEKVITIHNIRELNSVELCPGDSVRYQYSVTSDIITPSVGVVVFSLKDNCPEDLTK